MPGNPKYLALAIIILSGFLIFIYSNLILKSRVIAGRDDLSGFFLGKFSGFLIYGAVPFLVLIYAKNLSPADAGFSTGNLSSHILLTSVSVVIVVSVSFLMARKNTGLGNAGTINLRELTTRNLLVLIFGWIVYILGYEFLFRGVLWFLCYQAFGFVPALIINLIIYFLAHIDQGPLMSIGSIPVGVLLCVFAFMSGSFILPFIIHATMAVSYQCFSAYFNVRVSAGTVNSGK